MGLLPKQDASERLADPTRVVFEVSLSFHQTPTRLSIISVNSVEAK